MGMDNMNKEINNSVNDCSFLNSQIFEEIWRDLPKTTPLYVLNVGCAGSATVDFFCRILQQPKV